LQWALPGSRRTDRFVETPLDYSFVRSAVGGLEPRASDTIHLSGAQGTRPCILPMRMYLMLDKRNRPG
jgi:hypothetical protein